MVVGGGMTTRFPAALRRAGTAIALLATVLFGGSATTEPRLRIVALGDSLTAGGYARQVGQALALPVINLGIGGQKADAIAGRYGAIPVRVAVAGNRIAPGANALDQVVPEIFRTQDNVERTMRVTIDGITGTYRRTATGKPPVDTNVFLPDAGQTLPHAVAGVQVMTPLLRYDRPDILLLCIGRNNPVETYPAVLTAIEAIIARHRPAGSRIVLLGIPNAATPDEAIGTPRHAAIVAFNAELARRYPDDFIDIRAIYNAGGNPALPADRADRLRDHPPASLRADALHYNDAGRRLWADTVIDFIRRKHWLDAASGRH